jgi:phage terminase large subunit-like protein
VTIPAPLTPAERRRALEFIAHRQKYFKLLYFKPYPKQLEFFNLGATKRERLFEAGTQVGKSQSGAFEVACHLTGRYPDWWRGKRFDKPTRGWCAGVTSSDVRNVQQRKLCGTPGVEADWGTGMIPKECLIDRSRAPGIVDAIDQLQVRHITGGTSIAQFKSYEQGRAKFQGDTIDWGWADEEPDPSNNSTREVYDEFLSRLSGDGILFTTFTPLFGPTPLVNSFNEDHPDRGVIRMSLDEAEHFTEAEKAKRKAGYKKHEYDARVYGIPKLGSGAIFETPEEYLIEAPITHVPSYWRKLWGIDFGIGHPFAAVLILWDVDNDIIHVHHAIRMADALSIVQAAAMRKVAVGVPVAWPRDGTERDRNTGAPLSDGYKKHGLKMLDHHATWPDGSVSTEAGIEEQDEREKTGRLKYAAQLADLLEERRFYHRKDGKIVKMKDDLMSALRIAIMAKRFARAVPLGAVDNRPPDERGGLAANVDFDLF